MKMNLPVIIGSAFMLLAVGCGPIEDVKTDGGRCTDEFKTAYNGLSTNFSSLETMTVPAERVTLSDQLEDDCEEFFTKYAPSIECNGLKDNKAVKAKGEDFRQLCNAPLSYSGRTQVPDPLD